MLNATTCTSGRQSGKPRWITNSYQNHFGICVSSDTLSRFVQYKVNSLKKASFLNPEAFTIVSTDNIDFQLSFARVFYGKHTSSWHGTSIQAAQPLPSLSQCQNDQENLSPQVHHAREGLVTQVQILGLTSEFESVQ